MVAIKVYVILFLLTLLLQVGMVILTKSLAMACVMTKPNLVGVTLLVGEVGKFPQMWP